jgi:GNAT superfamily N-acetyltransferase
MEEIKVVKVGSKQEMDDFLNVTDKIYAGCSQYVPDMRSDVRAMFNSIGDASQRTSEAQPFVAYRGQEVVGRVVGVVNKKANDTWKTHNVRFSMIEFIDDLAVSKALLDAVEAWGKAQGMDKLQGPMGVTDFDKEGMLVEDFELRGSMTAYYNPAYYPKHMEQLGFEKEVDWLQIRINIPKEVPARYVRVAQYAREQFGLKVKFAKRHEVQKGEYGPKIFKLLNEAYAPIFGFSAFSQKQAQVFLDKYVPLFKMDMVPLVENEQGELVGIAVTMPSLTEALQKSHGRLWPTGWYHLLKSLKWKHEDNTEMLLVAVRPDYQGLGVNALFFDDLIPIYNKYGIKWAETGPQLEDNVRELTQWKPLHPQTVKRRRCWMKEISRREGEKE